MHVGVDTESLSVTAPDSTRPVPARVEVVAGADRGVTLRFDQGTLVVGTGRESQLRLSDGAISKAHCVFERLREGFVVRDLGSKNGSWYLGARLTQARLPLGALVQMGRTTLLVAACGQPDDEHESLRQLVAESPAMQGLVAQLRVVASAAYPVLLYGEPGVGKLHVARALHGASARACVVVDAASGGLTHAGVSLRSECRQATLDALHAAAAGAGTVVLRHVDEASVEVQRVLLAFLADCTRLHAEPVRVVATAAAVHVRSPLLQRLAAATVCVPPLRERPHDLAPLARDIARASGASPDALTDEAVASLQSRPWPGNVAELREAVLRYAAQFRPAPRAHPGFAVLRGAFERDYVTALLERHHGNVAAAAREAQLARPQLYRLVRRHHIDTGCIKLEHPKPR